MGGELNSFVSALTVSDVSLREEPPFIRLVSVQVHCVFPGPVLDAVLGGVGDSPLNTNRIDWPDSTQVHHHPLLVRFVRASGKIFVKVWVAFPKGCCVAISYA